MEEQIQDINEVASGDNPSSIIEYLSSRAISPVDLNDVQKAWNPTEHDVFDKTKRKDKMVETDAGTIPVPINRIGIPLQKLIVKSTVNFTFGNPVVLNAKPNGEQETSLLDAVTRIFEANKINSFNRRMARDLARCTEVAELWYSVEGTETHNNYGFDTKNKIGVLLLSPWNGNKLFPLFDGTGDMIAFSRQYDVTTTDNKKAQVFETYTAEKVYQWKKLDSDWEQTEGFPKKNPFGKIPVIYGQQEEVEWQDVESLINRLETLLSNFAEINDYHAAPKITVTGKIESWAQKGESGAVIEMEKGAEAKYLSWEHAPESVKIEIETLIRFIYSMTQTPDISFDSVKGLKEISGEALKMLFMDAHLKVQDKREILDEYLQRRIKVLLSILVTVNSSFKQASQSLSIKPEIVPFIINSEKQTIENLVTANGGKPIVSQKTAIQKLGWTDDVDKELDQIQEEEKQANTMNAFPTAE